MSTCSSFDVVSLDGTEAGAMMKNVCNHEVGESTRADVDEVLPSHGGTVRGLVHAVAAVSDAPKDCCRAAQFDAEFIASGQPPVAILVPGLSHDQDGGIGSRV